MGRSYCQLLAFISFLCIINLASSTLRCGTQLAGDSCPEGHCCSKWGYCGNTSAHCCHGCQSKCNCLLPPWQADATAGRADGVADIVTEEVYNEMLPHRGTSPCPGAFYTYDAFIKASNKFESFGTSGDLETRKREIAAFFAHTSHETTGGWDTAPDGRYSWGYCWIREGGATDPGLLPDYCISSNQQWPCVAGQQYYGRGPFQISYNYNYGMAGAYLGYDLLSNPDLVETDPYVSFQTAFWFWMVAHEPKPSLHDVMVGNWTPSDNDLSVGRVPGFGLTTNIVNGGIECGYPSEQEQDRIQHYKRCCEILGVDPGDNLSCSDQQPYGLTTKATRKNKMLPILSNLVVA
ncbi:basic endochitinase-like [Malania oleifera]|uniref:basic endochitinase-like n=1 Tax=Malania oleifera TaxID=397392 RepID=UPI0025AE6760|nr:basic endochitinase-like [Malania oleifera]